MRLGTLSESKLVGVHKDLQAVVRLAVSMTQPPDDFAIVQGNRTQAYQDSLYAQGRTRPGKVVTWTRNSRHIGGYAIDFANWKNGAIDWNDIAAYRRHGAVFKDAARRLGVPITWGGDWTNKDWGHIELSSSAYPKGTTRSLLKPDSGPVAAQAAPVATPAPTPVPTPPAAPPAPSRAVWMYNILRELGWSQVAAAGMVGNAQQESYADLRTAVAGDGGLSHGICQWNGSRLAALKSYAARAGKPWTDFETQVKFVDWELRSSEKRAWDKFQKADTAGEAVDAGIAYLRPSVPMRERRLKYAETLLGLTT